MIKTRNLLAYWPLLLGLFLGLYFVVFQIVGIKFTFLPGNLGDARFNIYVLEHLYQYLFVSAAPIDGYWDAPFMYPQESTISFSDNLLGTGLLYCLFRLSSFDVYTSFQLWFIFNTVLNYFFAYLFFNYLLKNKYAAVLGAMVFAFSIALIDQYSHAQTFPRFCIPIAFLFALKFFNSLKIKYFFLTVFFVVYQFYCALYLGFMLMIPISLVLLFSVVFQLKKAKEVVRIKWMGTAVLSLIANFLLLLPLFIPYINSPAMVKKGGIVKLHDIDHVFPSLPTIKSYFFIRSKTYYWDFLRDVGLDLPDWWGHQLFLGGLLMVCISFLLIYTLKKVLAKEKIKTAYWIFAASGILTFLLFLRFGDFSFYLGLYHLPGFGSLRSLQRIINIELLFFGFVLAATFLIFAKKPRHQPIAFLLLLGVFIADNYIYPQGYNRLEKAVAVERVENLKRKLETSNLGLFSYESVSEDYPKAHYHLDAMLTAQDLGVKTINGYTSTVPVGYYDYSVNLDQVGRKKWVKQKNITEEVFIVNEVPDDPIGKIIKKIKNSPEWLGAVEKQAEKKGISLEEALLLNANWVYENSEEYK